MTPEDLLGPLNDIEKKNAPTFLYFKGDRNILETGPRVSIVGSRHPSNDGLRNAQTLTKLLVDHGVIIVSGLALGIDTIAHKTAISEGGKTIAVLGTPLNKYYPEQNRGLQDEIMKNHLAISQFPPNYPTQRKNFPMRNKTMALISHASIIVEAGDTSGSLNQGWTALQLGRPLLILESTAKNPKLKWPQEMIKYGAIVINIQQIEKLMTELPASGSKADINVALKS
ncbi:MAG: DNA-protecting protein DprA [Candidatus Aenigmarchaeota archaeon]|nr:DNA-protecting protein DprA [Candidatus Aenigmarchaeota archaeon]